MLVARFYKLFFLLILSCTVQAQQRVWVFFQDKETAAYQPELQLSSACLANRGNLGVPSLQYSDIPVKTQYISNVLSKGVVYVNHSKWLNAICVEASSDKIEEIRKLSEVKDVLPVAKQVYVASVAKRGEIDMTPALKQMEGSVFARQGLNGKGVTIGVVDAGFHNANSHGSLLHLFRKKHILGTKDFLDSARTDFYSQQTSLDFHGRRVLELIAGKSKKYQNGFAYGSTFYLARSENGATEFRGEEHAWVRAMEWFDSLGVRLVNTSLGYSTGFTDSLENYKITDMDGKTSVISKAAQIAVDEKGMFIVVSAGNEGNKKNWRIVSSPADAPGVLSVGAVKLTREKAGYSSIGPSYNSYVKPNVVAFSLGGTSFSAPEVTGFVACLMEKSPKLSSKEIMAVMEQSSHLYPYPNNYVGYGIPLASRALDLLKGLAVTRNILEVHTPDTLLTINYVADTVSNKSIVIYHKENATLVAEMITLDRVREDFVVERKKKAARTTVDMGNRIVEIFWQKKEE